MSSGEIPIFEALSAPQTIAGCERRWFVLSAVVAAMLAGPAGIFAGKIAMAGLGGLVFSASVAFGARQTEKDPQFREVWAAAFAYQGSYLAACDPEFNPRPARGWL